jgi:NAD(P)-dependent dehydrogenase (short-subunit alcohol dehydrogenase family)
VVVTDVDEPGAAVEAIRKAAATALALRQDVTSESGWEEVVARTLEAYGRPDVLVNNAGIAVLKPLESMTLAEWNRQIDVNLTSVFLGCRAVIGACAPGGGSIVNLSSVVGLVGVRTGVAYGAAKGVRSPEVDRARARARRHPLQPVHPGFIWTNMQAQAMRTSDPSQVQLGPIVPLGGLGQPQDIADCVLYLASDESKYVTGAEFTVDGGMTAQ